MRGVDAKWRLAHPAVGRGTSTAEPHDGTRVPMRIFSNRSRWDTTTLRNDHRVYARLNQARCVDRGKETLGLSSWRLTSTVPQPAISRRPHLTTGAFGPASKALERSPFATISPWLRVPAVFCGLNRRQLSPRGPAYRPGVAAMRLDVTPGRRLTRCHPNWAIGRRSSRRTAGLGRISSHILAACGPREPILPFRKNHPSMTTAALRLNRVKAVSGNVADGGREQCVSVCT